jgi:hypothetical protein
MWIIIASWMGKKRYYIAAVLLSLLIGFSRVYLGVHFPTDLAGGWLLGGIVLAVYFIFGERLESLLIRGGMRLQLVVCAAAAFVMILYNPERARDMSGGLQALLMPGAVILGMGAGFSLTVRYLGFHAADNFGRRGAAQFFTLCARFFLGAAGIAVVFIVLSPLVRALGGELYRLGIFVQFAFLELWIYTGAPWLFQRLRLAETHAG